MIISFGKHKGRSLELVVIKWPDYVRWVMKQENPSGPLGQLRDEVDDLVSTFDAKPLHKECFGCQRTATRCSVSRDNADSVLFWCDRCDIHSAGSAGGLHVCRTYADAIEYADYSTTAPTTDLRILVRAMAEAKGLPARCGEKTAKAFFDTA